MMNGPYWKQDGVVAIYYECLIRFWQQTWKNNKIDTNSARARAVAMKTK